jgi:hypothetical protein
MVISYIDVQKGQSLRWLNVVAFFYCWIVRRWSRRRGLDPVEFEEMMSHTKRGPRPRRAVLDMVSASILEICVFALTPGLVAAWLYRRSSGAVAVLLNVAASTLGAFPLMLAVSVIAWSFLPERRTGSFYAHPERLLPPSLFAIGGSLLVGLTVGTDL